MLTRRLISVASLLCLLIPTGCVLRHDRTNHPNLLSNESYCPPAFVAEDSDEAIVAPGGPSPLQTQQELQLDALVEAVLARNPSVAQMVATWQAASARYPQVTSLDDPMFAGAIGPTSINSPDANFAYRLELSQKYPWPGKRALRGENARAEAVAAAHDIDDVRLQLVESTKGAYFDYFLAERSLSVNEEALRLLTEAKQNAESRFRTGQVPQQDILQADVEIGRQRERQLTLTRMRRVAMARINTLLNVPTDSPVPPPPKELRLSAVSMTVSELQARALAARPDLQALSNRIAAERASLELAYKEYYPDIEPFVMYDRFMGNMPEERDLALQLGAKFNVPVRREKRHAQVAEARFRLAAKQAELQRQVAQVNLAVDEAYQQVKEMEQAFKLYEKEILPASRESVKAAVVAYATGKVPFVSLLESQRSLIGLRERYFETATEAARRQAALERAVGGSLHTETFEQANPAPAELHVAPMSPPDLKR